MIYFNFYHFVNNIEILIYYNQFNLEFYSANLEPVNKRLSQKYLTVKLKPSDQNNTESDWVLSNKFYIPYGFLNIMPHSH